MAAMSCVTTNSSSHTVIVPHPPLLLRAPVLSSNFSSRLLNIRATKIISPVCVLRTTNNNNQLFLNNNNRENRSKGRRRRSVCMMMSNKKNHQNHNYLTKLIREVLIMARDVTQLLSFSTYIDLFKIAHYYINRFEQHAGDFLHWYQRKYRHLKPAIHLPQPPVDFPFKILDTPGEDKIRLVRELPRADFIVEAMCMIDVDQSTDSSVSSFFRNFVPTDYADYEDFCQLRIGLRVRQKEHLDVIKDDGTPIRLVFSRNRIIFSKSMDNDVRKYWRDVLPILGFDEAAIRFLIVYMARRNKLDHHLPRLKNVLTLMSTTN